MLRNQRGVVHRVLALFGDPSNAVWYQHRLLKDEVAPSERTLVNALRRLGTACQTLEWGGQKIVGKLVVQASRQRRWPKLVRAHCT